MKVEWHRHTDSQAWTYSILDRYQRELAPAVARGESGRLILSEVAPVVTLGRRSCPQDFFLSPERMAEHGIETYSTDRGGRATYHGPGQWVVFPVERLECLTGDSKGVRKIVERLLNTAYLVASRYDFSASIKWGNETGVWTSRGKVASVGIKIQDGVVLHGLSINGYATPQSFFGIRPCGLDAQPAYLLSDSDGFSRLGEELVDAFL